MILIDSTGLVAASGTITRRDDGMYVCDGTLYPPDVTLIDATPPGPGLWRYVDGTFEAVVVVPTVSKRSRDAILAELQAIDTRSIRALREGNQQRIDELEAQAQALRAEMAAL